MTEKEQELRPALSWGDALLRINELQAELKAKDSLIKELEKKHEIEMLEVTKRVDDMERACTSRMLEAENTQVKEREKWHKKLVEAIETGERYKSEIERLREFDPLKRYKTLRAIHQSEMRRLRQIEKLHAKDTQRFQSEIEKLKKEVREWMDDRDIWLARFDKCNRELEAEKEASRRLVGEIETIHMQADWRLLPPCPDPGHDERFCARCSAMQDAAYIIEEKIKTEVGSILKSHTDDRNEQGE